MFFKLKVSFMKTKVVEATQTPTLHIKKSPFVLHLTVR